MTKLLSVLAIAMCATGIEAQSVAAASAGRAGEVLRPQVHYSPARNWMNDPNGLVFFDGEYHLFYQYNPYGATAGHISWGHAISKDLLHWQELGVAIPEGDGQLIFTGSAVVDEKNTSGLCDGGKPCMVAIYTAHSGQGGTRLETQNIAVSQDHGRTWVKYNGNPVLDLHMSNFRDPSVSWSNETRSWLMAVVFPDEHLVVFYTSPDLKRWTELSRFGPANGAADGQWECPSFLHVPSANGKESIWALKVGINPGALQGGSGEQYFLGGFDGKTFVQSSEPGSHGWADYGKDSYCAIPYNHLPPGARPTLIGWMDNWQYAGKLPTSPWRGQMTLPRELSFVHDAGGLALAQHPVLESLRNSPGRSLKMRTGGETKSKSDTKSESGMRSQSGSIAATAPLEMELNFTPKNAGAFGVRLYSDAQHWTELGLDTTRRIIYVDRTHSGQTIADGFAARTEAPLAGSRPLDIHLILDRISLEVFAQNGTVALTNLLFPASAAVQIRPFAERNAADVAITGTLWSLRPSVK